MMGSDGRVIVELELDADGIPRATARAASSIERIEKRADRAGGALNKLGGFLKGLVATYVVSQLGRIAKGLYEIATAAAETESKFQTVFRGAAERVDAFGDRVAHNAGLTKTEFRDLAATSGAILDGMGADIETTAAETERIIGLAADFASFHNKSIDDTFRAIRSGITGEMEPLKQLGIVLSADEVKLRALAETGKATEKSLTALEIAQARLNLIFEKAGVAVGDLERTQDSAANSGRRLAAVVREARDAFAIQLLGAIERTQARIAEYVDGEKLIEWAQKAGQEVAWLIEDIANFIRALGKLVGSTNAAEKQLTVWAVSLTALNRVLLNTERWALRAAFGIDAMKKAWAGWTGDAAGYKAAHDSLESTRARLAELNDMLGKGLFAFRINRGEVDANTEAFEDAAEAVDELTRSLGDGGRGGAASAARAVKTALQQLREEVKEADRALSDLQRTWTDPASQEILLTLRAQRTELELQAEEMERLINLELRRRQGTLETEEQRRLRIRFPGQQEASPRGPSPLPGVQIDLEDIREGPEEIAESWARTEAAMMGTLDRMAAGIHNFATEADERFRTLAEGLGAIFGNLTSAFSSMFETAVQEDMRRYEAMGKSQQEARALAEEENRKMFVNMKRAASAEAIVSTLAGATRALKDFPFPLNLGVAASILAAGYANVRAINAQQIGGGAPGGGSSRGSSLAPSGVSGLAAGLSLQGRGSNSPIVNVQNNNSTNVMVKGPGMPQLVTEIEVQQDLNRKWRGSAGGL